MFRRRRGMEPVDGVRERLAEVVGERAAPRPVCEHIVFVEAAHVDRPFHRLAGTAERQSPVRSAGDRFDTKIDVGSMRLVESVFAHAGRPPPFSR